MGEEAEGGKIVVIEADLDIDGVDDEDEETVGAIIGVAGPRKKITLAHLPGDPDGIPWEKAVLSVPSNLSVWTAETGGSELGSGNFQWDNYTGQPETPPHQLDWDEFPDELWVQGVTAGTPNVTLTYEVDDAQWAMGANHTDTVKFTVVSTNLTATDLDGNVSEEHEMDPGAFVHCNIDNDNGNTNQGPPVTPIADMDDVTNAVTGEDDLKAFSIALTPADLQIGTVVLTRWNAAASVWKSATKGAANSISFTDDKKTWDLSNETQRADFNAVKSSLFVEGCQTGESGLLVWYSPSPGVTGICWDQVKYTFIAATCDRQPTPSERSRIGSTGWFPALVDCEWSITEPDYGEQCDGNYNCIAWSIGETGEWFDPWDIDKDFGNDDGVFSHADMVAFYRDSRSDYKKTDWELIAVGDPEQRAAACKAAYYPLQSSWEYDADPQPPWPGPGYHAAQRKTCGCGAGEWIMFESKLGQHERIEHDWDQLNGQGQYDYGQPLFFFN